MGNLNKKHTDREKKIFKKDRRIDRYTNISKTDRLRGVKRKMNEIHTKISVPIHL